MKKVKQLKPWPLVLIAAILIGISAATTTVLANNDTLTVKAALLNVRLGPGLAYKTMGQVQSGATLTVLKEENSWYQVRLAGNRIGWVASWLVNTTEPATDTARVATVTSPTAIRESAAADAKQLDTLTVGATVNVLYTEAGWTQIRYKNTAAWVLATAVKDTGKTVELTAPKQTTVKADPTPAAKSATTTVTTNAEARLRETAGINGKAITTLTKGTTLTVLGQKDDWYQVRTKDGQTGYIAAWVVTTPSGKDTPSASKLSEATIVIDPGHGGSDAGALAGGGQFEKTYTLQTAKAIGDALEAQGAKVVYTRSADTYVGLAPRPAKAKEVHADAFISIHYDSSPKANEASGFTTYYFNSSKDKALATSLNRALGASITLDNRGTAYGNYAVLRENSQPAVLMELGYINTTKDFKLIKSSAYHKQVAAAVVKGLNAYFTAKAQ